MKHLLLLVGLVCSIQIGAIGHTNTDNQMFQVNSLQNNSIYSNKGNTYVVYEPWSNKPRNVKGYTEDGDMIDTGNSISGNPSNMWEAGYAYYYYNGYWYRTDGRTWERWETFSILGFDLWGYWTRTSNPGSGATQYYKEVPTPIGRDTLLYILCLTYLLRITYKKYKNGEE